MVGEKVWQSRCAELPIGSDEAPASDILMACVFYVRARNSHRQAHLHTLAWRKRFELPDSVLSHLRPGGDELHRGVEDIAHGDVGSRLAAVVADRYDVAGLLAPAHGFLQRRLVDIKPRSIEDVSVNAARFRLQLIATDGKAVLQQCSIGQILAHTYLQGDGVRAVLLKKGDGPAYALAVVPELGRIGGVEGDTQVQIIDDCDVMGYAAAKVLVGEGVSEKLAHLHRIWIGGLLDGQAHDAQMGRCLPQVVAASPCAGALPGVRPRQAGPGHLGAPLDLLARGGASRGIEAEESLLAGVPVQVEGVKVPPEAFGIKCGDRPGKNLSRARLVRQFRRQDGLQIQIEGRGAALGCMRNIQSERYAILRCGKGPCGLHLQQQIGLDNSQGPGLV